MPGIDGKKQRAFFAEAGVSKNQKNQLGTRLGDDGKLHDSSDGAVYKNYVT
jgi:hypothetical protein